MLRRRQRECVGVAEVELGVRGEHAIWEQVAELVLRPSVQDAMNDLVQVRARVDVVGNARGDNRKNVCSALCAVIAPGEEPILAIMESAS